MTRAGFGWRVGLLAFTVLSITTVLVGWVVIQFDDQYEHSSVAGRMLVGVFGGALGALVLSPINALVSSIVGGVAGRRRRKRLRTTSGS